MFGSTPACFGMQISLDGLFALVCLCLVVFREAGTKLKKQQHGEDTPNEDNLIEILRFLKQTAATIYDELKTSLQSA